MNKRIDSLNGLRFIFMIFLFVHHLDVFTDLQLPGFSNLMLYLGEGAISVDFFFILSGFLLTYSYLPRMERDDISSSTFMYNRFSRLWPTHALIWVITVILYSGGVEYLKMNLKTRQFWVGLFLLQSLVPTNEDAFWGNGPAWSMSTLLVLYLCFCLLAKITHKQRKEVFAVITAMILFNSIVVGNSTPVATWLYYISPLFRILDFLGGMLLCEWMMSKSEIMEELTKRAGRLQFVAIIVMLWFMGLSANTSIHFNPRFQSYYYLIPCVVVILTFSLRGGYFLPFVQQRLFKSSEIRPSCFTWFTNQCL